MPRPNKAVRQQAAHVNARAKSMRNAISRWMMRLAREQVKRETDKLIGRIKKADGDGGIDDLVGILVNHGSRQAVDASVRLAADDDVRRAVESKEFRIKVVEEIRQAAEQRARRISDVALAEINTQVRQIVSEALDEDPRPTKGEIARRIRNSFFGRLDDRVYAFSPGRADVIARTELAQAENTGIVEGYKEAGVKRIRWIAYSDGRSGDRHHERMNGKEIDVGDRFTTPLGNKLRYPGDPRAPIADTVNCRCTVRSVEP